MKYGDYFLILRSRELYFPAFSGKKLSSATRIFKKTNRNSPINLNAMSQKTAPKLILTNGGNFHVNGEKLKAKDIAQIIYLTEQGLKISQIIEKLGFDRKTVKKYQEMFLKGEDYYAQKTKEKYSGVHTEPERLEFFHELAKECPGLTLEGMKLRYELCFDERISVSMICYILDKFLDFSYKKITPIEWARTQEQIIELHDEF